MYRFLCILILSVLFIFTTQPAYAQQLSGLYTIGAGEDYTDFNAAVSDLTSQGVNGAVTFDVINGDYDEQIVIPFITGASAVNTITFRAQSGNAGDVTLFHTASSAGDNYVVRLDAASYIVFNNLTFAANGTTYARVMEILNSSHHITISNSILNGYASAGSSSNQILIYANNTVNYNLLINNCEFNDGSYGVYLIGMNTTNLSGSNTIQSCTFNSLGYYSIYLQYQNSPQILQNHITGSSTNGMFLNYCHSELEILENRIHASSYGIYLNNCTGGDDLETDPGLIANNFISANSNYGVYLSNVSNQNFYHNSVNIASGNAGTVGFYIYNGSNNNIVNNNFVHSGWGLAAQIYSASAVNIIDYNNYFSNGNYLAAWGATSYYDFVSYQTAGGKDAHSVSVYPHFTSSTDLHTMTPWLNGMGTSVSEVTEDIDGEVRHGSTPDIGADEFTPDAANTTPLAGHYTIGGSSPDYTTLSDAVSDLLIKGVSDTVFMEFRNGTYELQQTMYTFPGTAEDKPVIFQAESGNRDNVTLYHYATGANDNYVLYLHGADYLHFRDLSFSGNANTSAYSTNIFLSGGVNGFYLIDCKLTGSTSGSTYASLLSGQTVLSQYRKIQGNIFNNGGYGIYTSGINHTTSQNYGAMITDNEFNSQGNYALHLVYENSVLVHDNIVNNASSYGFYLNYCHDEIEVLRNRVHASSYGIYLNNCTGGDDLETGPGLIANNFVSANSNYGVYLSNVSNQNFYHNSVNIASGNTGTAGFYIYNGGNNNIVNNNFVNSGWGLAAQIYSASAVNIIDYNNYFSNGNYLAAWGATSYYDFASYQTGGGKDAHSVSVYPHFTSSTDLHTMTPWLNGMGTSVSEVTEDIDGEARHGSTPDIGADEFTPDAANTTPLAGHYTIGGSSPDYTTLSDAVSDLLIKGVSDTVFMEFRNGTYELQQTMYTFPGTAEDKPVIFQAESGNRDNVTLYHYATGANDNYVLYLHGADYLHFRDLSFSGNANTSAYSTNIFLSGGVNGFYLIDCKLTGSTSGSTYASLLSGQTVLSQYRKIQGNIFNNGGYGIYTSGINNTTSQNYGAMITDNEFNSQGNYALHLVYENSVLVHDNIVNNASSYGFYLNYCHDEIEVLRNRVHASSYGIYLNNCTGGDDLETGPGLIANNFASANSNYGVYLSHVSNQNFYHNSVNIASGNTGTAGFYISGGGNNTIVNNNFVNSGWGLAAQIYSASAVNIIDYNNYFSNGNYLAAWGATSYYDFVSYQTAGGKDAHSVSVYPHFTSSTDLHTMTPWLNGMGTSVSEVTEDIDGEARHGSTPDIGADEFTPDAANTTPLAGHYTIGGSSPDYTTLSDAVSDLLIKGVSDTVFMEFRNGTYELQQTMYTFPGTAEDKPVIFQAESGNRDNVTLYHYATGANDNYVLYLHGADYLHFRDLSFSGNANTSAYSTNIFLSGGVNGFYLIDCKLTGSTSGSTYASLLSGQTVLSQYRKIQGNIFNNGGYGIYTSGINNTTSQNYGAMITDNEFNSQGNYALHLVYENSVLVHDNIVNNASSYGFYLNYCHDEIEVLRNQVHASSYGIYLNNCTGGDDLETGPGLIANNFASANSNYGVYLSHVSNQNFYHNSVNIASGNTGTAGFYISGGGNNNIINNIFSHMNTGYAYYVYSGSSISTSDYNDLYTTGVNIGYWGADQTTLADFQTASGQDAHSISANPGFTSATDLHTVADALDSAATPLAAVTHDIDGEIRDAMYPDIGADEFDSTTVIGIEDDRIAQNSLPKEFRIYDNYPNPFNPVTNIKYDLPETAHVRLEVYNTLGQLVKVLVDQNQSAGRYNYKFDAVNLSSGMYFYRIKAGKFHVVQKMILQR